MRNDCSENQRILWFGASDEVSAICYLSRLHETGRRRNMSVTERDKDCDRRTNIIFKLNGTKINKFDYNIILGKTIAMAHNFDI